MGRVSQAVAGAERASSRARAKATATPAHAAAGRTQGGGVLMRVLAALLAMFWGLAFYGVIDLLAFAEGAEFHATLLLSTGWGLFFLLVVATPLVAMCIRPSALAPSALAQVALAGAALILTATVGGSPRHLTAAAALLVTVALV